VTVTATQRDVSHGVQAVIFDFDGVIVESMDIKTQAFVELFRDHPEHHETIVRLHLENGGMSRYD
jgi:beta-phosphoglucomutase-like phosphatase (HAD superfamily)